MSDNNDKKSYNYLLSMPIYNLTKEKIEELLSQKNVTHATRNGFTALLTACELARYTPLSVVEMQNDYDKAALVINALDKQLNS